jgi:uncharacterized protein YbcI
VCLGGTPSSHRAFLPAAVSGRRQGNEWTFVQGRGKGARARSSLEKARRGVHRFACESTADISTPEPTRSGLDRGSVAAEISREIVKLHANLYGRGPTKAKTFVGDDYILCLLEDVFTRGERTLVQAGKTEQVWSMRHAFQDAVEEDFRRIVTDASGRTVRAFLSMVHVEPEVSAELFLLEPIGDPDPGNGEMPEEGPELPARG